MIEFQKVTFRHHYANFDVFSELDLKIPSGQNTVLCDIQSGKTTLCKMLLGLLPPQSGKIFVDGTPLYSTKKFTPQSILYLPQKPALFLNKTVRFNVGYPLKVRKILQKNDPKIAEIAQKTGLSEVLDVKVKNLSERQKKWVSIARGLTVSRKIVLFDGFFDNTETDCVFSPQEVLPLFAESECTVVLTTQKTLVQGNCIVLDGGKCVYAGDSAGAKQTVDGLEWLADRI